MFTSEAPVEFDKARWLQALKTWSVDGRLLLDFNRPEQLARAKKIVSSADRVGPVNPRDEMRFAVEFRESILQRTQGHSVITDDNMGGEWPARRRN